MTKRNSPPEIRRLSPITVAEQAVARWGHPRGTRVTFELNGETINVPTLGAPVVADLGGTPRAVIEVLGGDGPAAYPLDWMRVR